MVFEQKKIQAETLSEYLRQVREGLGLSQQEVTGKTHIKPVFFQALESGDFRILPPDVYVLGFLRQLAEIYGVPPEILADQYKKEKNITNQIQKRSVSENNLTRKFFNHLVITPKILAVVAGSAFILLTLGYIVWQVLAINKTPFLEVSQPVDRQAVAESFVKVVGSTDTEMNVTVNGQEVFVDKSGKFQTQLGMEAGPKLLHIVASNKFGKTTVKDITVVGQVDAVPLTGEVNLKLEFSAEGTLGFVLDDGIKESLVFHNGDIKVLTAQKKITVSTTNAGATVATFDGKKLGALGRAGEQLENIPFFANSNASTTTP